jgi:hypothetical protein
VEDDPDTDPNGWNVIGAVILCCAVTGFISYNEGYRDGDREGMARAANRRTLAAREQCLVPKPYDEDTYIWMDCK